jgi:hypothetical protein
MAFENSVKPRKTGFENGSICGPKSKTRLEPLANLDHRQNGKAEKSNENRAITVPTLAGKHEKPAI